MVFYFVWGFWGGIRLNCKFVLLDGVSVSALFLFCEHVFSDGPFG